MKISLHKPLKFIKTHKIWSSIALIIILLLGYYTYGKIFSASTSPQYILEAVHEGTLTQTVTGSGQVSSENQLDIASEVSGKILTIYTTVGQRVRAGDLIATIDSRDALTSLENAQIAYAKLTNPAKLGDVINAENDLSKAYSDALSAISDSFLHVPGIMSGLKEMLTSSTGYVSNQQNGISSTGRNYAQIASQSYDITNNDYATILQEYKKVTKTSPTADIEALLLKTYNFMKEVSETLKNTQTAITFVSVSQPDYNPSQAVSAGSSVSTWSGQANSDLSSLLSAKNAIASTNYTYKKLVEGADTLDIQSQKLSLQQAERTYQKYFIRAPFEGVVGRIPVHVYDQAGSGTVIATVSSSRKITNIALNEVDAVKVAVGQKVLLTFDALQGLKIDGTVSQVDLVGTASQGVVTYNVKIAFDGADSRIRPGMSIDATIITKEKLADIVVPAGAVKTQGSGRQQTSYVETLDAQNVLQKKTVVVGESDDTNVEIVSGIEKGQKIIVRTLAGGTVKSTTPTILNGLSGGQGNVIRNANRTAR